MMLGETATKMLEIKKHSTHKDETRLIVEIRTNGFSVFDDDCYYKGNVLHLPLKVETIQALIACGANVNGKLGKAKTTPLHEHTNVEIIITLIANGADVNAQDIEGNTPLHYHRNDPSIVKVLIAAKANVRAKNIFGVEPIQWTQNKEVLNALLMAGADINATALDLKTCLFKVTRPIKLYLEKGADTEVKDASGNTPLHHFVAFRHTLSQKDRQILRQGLNDLLDYGANPYSKNKNGLNAFEQNAKLKPLSSHYEEIAKILNHDRNRKHKLA